MSAGTGRSSAIPGSLQLEQLRIPSALREKLRMAADLDNVATLEIHDQIRHQHS